LTGRKVVGQVDKVALGTILVVGESELDCGEKIALMYTSENAIVPVEQGSDLKVGFGLCERGCGGDLPR
jgi:hypothetical protein